VIGGNSSLLNLLGKLTLWKVTSFATDSEGMDTWQDDRTEADLTEGANVVSSLLNQASPWDSTKYHAVLLDLDVPAYLVPSSRPGHTHLYIDVRVTEERYFDLLDQLADCGVIEHGYASASKKKGGTFLRLPWIKKEGVAK
jgi:hypothetical protein